MPELNNLMIIMVIIFSILAFIIGFIISHKRFTIRLGNLDNIKKQYSQWNAELDSMKNELQILSENVETQRQATNISIATFNQEKQQANQQVVEINTTLHNKKQRLKEIEQQTYDLQQMESKRLTIEKDFIQALDKQKILSELQTQVDELKSELSLYSEMEGYIEYGLYPLPAYGEATSGAYNEQLKSIRQEQKNMLKEATAYTAPANIEITGNVVHDKRLLKNQGHLVITAFNSECDYLISKVSSKNYEATMTKIEKLAEQLEKRLVSLEIGISLDYVELKMRECTVYYQYICQKEAEAEEQREIRAQIREENAAQREIEKALQDAQKEEEMLQKAMEKARRELANASEEQKQQYELQLQELTDKLTAAELRKERSLSMAQQTRRGHVYVISNIGSFGEDVYKIGMTRRLEPLDRVKELSSASVPFSFDVHAMIYSEDAPTLEKELHNYFNLAAINKVNSRKEFFEIKLEEIRKYVEDEGLQVHWTMVADATEYRQSLVIAEQQMELAA